MSRRDKWESYLVAVVNKDVGGGSAALVRAILRFLSYIYLLGVQTRVFLYNHRILRPKSLGCQIISVGNITVGGTGKTPIVEMIAKELQQGGRKVAILSRGYKSRSDNDGEKSVRVVSDGENILLDVETSGDEPYMLAKEVAGAVVLVCRDRVKAAKYAIKKFKTDTVILDDGYQYLPINRQVNIALIDCTNPFGRYKLLPRGILREPVKNLNRADIFFLTKTKGMDLHGLKKKLNKLNPKAEIVETSHMPRHLNDVYTSTKKDLKWLAGRRVVCISGIASPSGFEKALTELGAVLVSSHRFSDHHLYTKEDIQDIVNCALGHGEQNAEAIITTQKDAVRFPQVETTRKLPIYYLRVEIEILRGSKDFYTKIGSMCY